MGEAFHQHERGEISDEDFAAAMCHEMNMSLSYEQFSHGWQAVLLPCARRLSRLCKITRAGASRCGSVQHEPFAYDFLAG